MTVRWLARNLTNETWVTIKDKKSKKTLWSGYASRATFGDRVKDWDFSEGHIIYI